MSDRLQKAREAYDRGDLDASKEAHKPEAISEEHKIEKGRYIGDMVYGALDGIVTTFAVVLGVVGASPYERHSYSRLCQSHSRWPQHGSCELPRHQIRDRLSEKGTRARRIGGSLDNVKYFRIIGRFKLFN